MRNSRSRRLEAFQGDEVKARYLAAYDALLQKWPVEYEERYVSTYFGLTHVIVSGPTDAPPLVLLHAAVATALVWRPNVEGLSRHFRTYAVDVIGQYGKSVSSRAIRSRWDFANWMCDVFDALEIARTSLVGNCYGAFLALNQASLVPEYIDRVVMINPAGIFASFGPPISRLPRSHLLSVLLPWAKRPRRTFTGLMGRNILLRPDESELADLVSIVWTQGMRLNGIIPELFLLSDFLAIRSRTLLLMGDNDPFYDPHEILELAREWMPLLEAQIVGNAHRIAAMARPDEVNARMIRFLGSA